MATTPHGPSSGSDSTSLLQLPDALLLAVMRCCADSQGSLASAARVHSRLHQAVVLARTSISVELRDQAQLDSFLMYLDRQGQHVDSITLTGDWHRHSVWSDVSSDDDSDNNYVTLRRLPANLRLRKLQCNNLRLLGSWADGGHGFEELLQANAPIKQVWLTKCLLEGDGCPEGDLTAALSDLPALEHLCIDRCTVAVEEEGEYVAMRNTFDCGRDMFANMGQLTALELSGCCMHPGQKYTGVAPPVQVDLSAFTRLVDLRLESEEFERVPADMLSGVCSLTRLEFVLFKGFDARVLAGKALLQHLTLQSVGAEVAELLSQLQHMQQLTHLDLEGSWDAFEEGNPPAAAFSALTASSKLQHLGLKGCTVPAGALQHMFPTGRKLPELRSLDLSSMRVTAGTDNAGFDGARLVSCCPSLRSLNIYLIRCSQKLYASLRALSCVTRQPVSDDFNISAFD